MNRCPVVTKKLNTIFGALYLHLDISPERVPIGLRISTAQKHEDSQIGKLLDQISQGYTDLLEKTVDWE